VIPVPVCTTPLSPPGGKGGQAIVRSLEPEQWMQILIPEYQPGEGLNATNVDCTGHYVFANESLRFGVALNGFPRRVNPDELIEGAGPRGLRVLWLPVLAFDNGDVGGPVALVRGIDDRAEVYGIGSFKGPENTKLTPVRMGNETIVVAEAKRCPEEPRMCRKEASFFLLRRGRLLEAATVDIERVQQRQQNMLGYGEGGALVHPWARLPYCGEGPQRAAAIASNTYTPPSAHFADAVKPQLFLQQMDSVNGAIDGARARDGTSAFQWDTEFSWERAPIQQRNLWARYSLSARQMGRQNCLRGLYNGNITPYGVRPGVQLEF